MENASKALIIAGSILVAIMIVALGVRVFNKAKSSADTSGLEQQEILTFNKQWEKYSGKQLGSNVKNLFSTAISNYAVNKDNPIKIPTVCCAAHNWMVNGSKATVKTALGYHYSRDEKNINTNFSNYVNNLSYTKNVIESTHTYTVELYYSSAGIVMQMCIIY